MQQLNRQIDDWFIGYKTHVVNLSAVLWVVAIIQTAIPNRLPKQV